MNKIKAWAAAVDKKLLTIRFFAVLECMLLLSAIMLFLTGTVKAGRELVDIAAAFTMLFEFLRTFVVSYDNIVHIPLGILYLIIVLILFKKTLVTVKHTIFVFTEEGRSAFDAFVTVQQSVGDCFVGIFVSSAFCMFCYPSAVHVHLIATVILAFISLIIGKIAFSVHRAESVSAVFIEIGCIIFFLVPLFLVSVFAQNNAVYEIFNKVYRYMILGVNLEGRREIMRFIYDMSGLLSQVMYFVITLIAISVYAKANFLSLFRNPLLKRPIKAIIGIVISLCVLSFVLFMTDGGVLTLKNLIGVWEPYMPLLLSGFALYATTFFYNKIRIRKKKE